MKETNAASTRCKMETEKNQKIYRINSTRTNFIYATSENPDESNIVYNR